MKKQTALKCFQICTQIKKGICKKHHSRVIYMLCRLGYVQQVEPGKYTVTDKAVFASSIPDIIQEVQKELDKP